MGVQEDHQGGHSDESVLEGDPIALEASKLRWYHCIKLTPTFTTQGHVGWSAVTPEWEGRYLFPSAEELRGKSLLDIGTMNGFFAFEAERRGASTVLAID